ncbi:MAG: LacI family DNA-binding transcriptional regulator [Vicinamibacteraceae bacterium]
MKTSGRPLTMVDVARLADVSPATVSAVVNGKGRVSPERQARVREAMAALDYHPDHIARSLKIGRTQVIGMVVPDISNQFFLEVVQGIETEALQHGYSLILCNSGGSSEREQTQLSTLFSRRVDGAIVACSDSSSTYDGLIRRRFPLVFVDRVPVGFTRGAVVSNNVQGAYDATRHLIGLGHTRIAIITGDLRLSSGVDRVEGFRKAMQEAHLPIRDEYFSRGDFQLDSGYRCGQALLRLAEPPTAVLSCNNKMTLGLMRAAGELRVPCPGHVSVLGFDDFEWAASFSPRLTTVAQPTHDIGRRAMKMLLGKLNPSAADPDTPPDSLIVLDIELRVRESTAPPPTDIHGDR